MYTFQNAFQKVQAGERGAELKSHLRLVWNLQKVYMLASATDFETLPFLHIRKGLVATLQIPNCLEREAEGRTSYGH